MEAVTFQDMQFAVQKIENRKCDKGNPKVHTAQFQTDYLRLSLTEVERGLARFGIIGIAQNCVQTNIQLTLLGLDYGVTGEPDASMAFSVIMCLICICIDFPDMLALYRLTKLHAKEEAKGKHPIVDKSCWDEKTYAVNNSIRKHLISYGFLLLLYLFFVLWILLKVLALFVCPNHMWNFKASIFFSDGCT